MFETKVQFENSKVEYKVLTFSAALNLAEDILDEHKLKPVSVEILEDSRVVASLRIIR